MTQMHPNSLLAYAQERPRLSQRAEVIFENVLRHGRGSDRQIMKRMGFTDPNKVRPRITESVVAGVFVEVGDTVCDDTGKRVRVVDVAPQWRVSQ